MMKLLLLLGLGNTLLNGFVLYHLIKLRQENYSNMNQQRVNDLAEQLRNGNNSAEAAAEREKAEVAEAINNPNIDTSALEAEIARNANLAALFEGIYTPPVTEPTTPSEPETPAETPSEPAPEVPAPTEGGGEVPSEPGSGEVPTGETPTSETPGLETPAEGGSETGSETGTETETAPDLSEANTGEFPAAGSETGSEAEANSGTGVFGGEESSGDNR
jgi:hypothetical protein